MDSLYHTLRASLDALICPNCAGIGILVCAQTQLQPFTPTKHVMSAYRCEVCDGNGTKPKEPT